VTVSLNESTDHYPHRAHEPLPERFADVEAVRARLDVPVGACTVLREAWQRYGLPLAVTEAHLGGTREEQLRWLYEVWLSVQRLRKAKVDVRAVTAWSLLGAFDWNVLVTRATGFYESGAFDVRAPAPRPTAIARLVNELATTGRPNAEPLVAQPGWWRRPDRLFHPPADGRTSPAAQTTPTLDMQNRSLQPLLILGASGTLGSAFVRLCNARGIAYHLSSRAQLDLTRPVGAEQLLDETNAWAVVNAAGYVNVDDAEREPERALAINALGPAAIAEACAQQGIPMLAFSSDLVFDGGQSREPYAEDAPVAPLNAYGRSKMAMESRVLACNPLALVVRTSAFFGPWDESNFLTTSLRTLEAGGLVSAPNDVVVSPTYVPDLVNAALDLLIDGERRLWHLANVGAVTWAELACYAAELANVSRRGVLGRPVQELGLTARRPAYSALRSGRGWIMPDLEQALTQYMKALEPAAPTSVAA
jgi:dTDP-4-dehydrorhamnose reductase